MFFSLSIPPPAPATHAVLLKAVHMILEGIVAVFLAPLEWLLWQTIAAIVILNAFRYKIHANALFLTKEVVGESKINQIWKYANSL